jgi:hypothetical protein
MSSSPIGKSVFPFLTSVSSLLVRLRIKKMPTNWYTADMISSTQQLQLSSKNEKRSSFRQLCTQLTHNRCISWSLNLVLVVTTIVLLLLVGSLDVSQTAFCVHLFAFCITSAVLIWTKDSRNALWLSLVTSVTHFLMLSFIIWDCEPIFFVVKLAVISCFWLAARTMRISNARLMHVLDDQKLKPRVRITIVQLLIGASLVLVASLHLAYLEQEAFSFAEMALWSCFIMDFLRHFGSWKMTMKRVFRDVKGMSKILSRRNSKLQMLKGAKRRQNIMIPVGALFTAIVGCAFMISANPALGLLLQHKSNECKQRNPVGVHRISAFAFPAFFAFQIAYWVMIYSHVLKKRRNEKLRDTKKDSRQVLQGSYINASQQDTKEDIQVSPVSSSSLISSQS